MKERPILYTGRGHGSVRPQPMLAVARALIPLKDASEAIARGLEAWNQSQLRDAIRSTEFFIAQAKEALEQAGAPVPMGIVEGDGRS
jgi:hypothetical protein